MKQSCVSAFARAARTIALAAVVLTAGATTLLAQDVTGKLEGKVRDQQGAPIANAQVIIVGTKFGAQSNADGYYFINNVPAGVITIQASFIGYKTTRITGVRMVSGQTITSDVSLEATPVQVQEITVVAAANELVPRDAVTTKQTVSGDYADKLPVDRIAGVLALQPGVVVTPGGGLSVRGGRTDETGTVVDGVPVGSGNRGTGFVSGGAGRSVTIGTNGFEDASITTGASSAASPGGQSGVVAISTRTGGAKFTGAVGYESDELFGTSVGLGFNRVTASLGGPIVSNLTFFVSGVLEGSKSQGAGVDRANSPLFVVAGVDTIVNTPSAYNDPATDTTAVSVQQLAVYTGKCDAAMGEQGWAVDIRNSVNPDIASNYGVDCQGIRLPGTANSVYQLQGKLNLTYGTGSRVFVSALASQAQGRNFTYTNLYNPQAIFGNLANNQVYTFGLTQNLAKSSARALALDLSVSYQHDQFIQSPLTRESEVASRDPFGGFMVTPLQFQFNFDNFPLDQTLLDNFQQNISGSRRSPYDLDNLSQYSLVDKWRNNAYGLLGWSEGGGPTGRLTMNKENRWVYRASLDWQVDRYNRVKFGGGGTQFDMTQYSMVVNDQFFSDFWMEKPVAYGGYLEDRLDLGDVVLVAGVRYDYYKSNAGHAQYCAAATPTDSAIPCQRSTRVSSNPILADPNLTTAEALDSIYVADQSHDYISPHLQVSFPVSERTNFRLSYAQQVQPPDFSTILGGINTDLGVTNTNNVFGSDLDFGKTITFEFGIRHAFSDDMVLDFSAYNRDVQANSAGRIIPLYDPVSRTNVDTRLMTNADFGNYRGFDVRLDKRIGSLFNGTLAYTFSDAKNTGSDPLTYINFGSRIVNLLSGGNDPPPQAYLPTTYTRPHNLAGSFSVTFPNQWKSGTTGGAIFQNVGIFATFRLASGTAYTRCPSGEGSGDQSILSGTVCSRSFQGDVNGSRLPTFRNADLRVTKGFRFGSVDLTAYLDARNVFNFTNVTTVFTQTNSTANDRDHQQTWSGDSGSYAKEAAASSAYDASNGDISLPASTACGTWATQDGKPAAPNCVYLIRAEQRFGDGDGVFTLAEQRRASDAFYYTARGLSNFTAAPRRLRLGLELNF